MRAQLAVPHVLVAHVGVGNVPLVERIAHPAVAVGVRPRHPHAQTRYRRRVRGRVRGSVEALKVEPKLQSRSGESGIEPGLRREDPGAARIVAALGAEGLLRNLELEARQAKARFEGDPPGPCP
jgi:hypothetical protein